MFRYRFGRQIVSVRVLDKNFVIIRVSPTCVNICYSLSHNRHCAAPREKHVLTFYVSRVFPLYEINTIMLLVQTTQSVRARRAGFDPGRARDFSLLHGIQTGAGAHPASCLIGTKILSPGVKLTTLLLLVPR
jgi:hypothetical protein